MICDHCLFSLTGLLVTVVTYDDISHNKIASQSHTYNDNDASKAVDGYTATCMQSNAIGVGTSFSYRTVWWKVDLGEVHNIFSINIQFRNYNSYDDRQRGRFAGFSLYVSHSDVLSNADIKGSTLCYKDGLQLPPLNFTAVCTENGRYVIYYNERLQEDTYPDQYEFENVFTELCEVIVLGCNNAGFYGKNCDTPCPTNCKDNTCHIQSGSCFTCKLGWIGIYCETECKEGWYGVNCKQQCERHCRDGATCNQVTGHCDRGCEAGWTGDMCDKVCDEGYYGYNCFNTCSDHCLNSSPCNKQTGHCDKGCNSGYRNSDCSRECPPGYFGMNCMERCSGHCIYNEPCDHVSGVCPSGCQEGYILAFCNNTCTNGYFGPDCSQVCSSNCKPDTCRHTDGGCSCSAGWMGYNCTTECMLSYGENCRYPCSFNCINQTCDKFNGSCLHSCKNGWQCDTDVENYVIAFFPSSNHLPIIVGGTIGVGVCMFIVIGVVIKISIKRRKSSNTKRHTSDLQSTSAAEPVVNTEGISNYQQLNFSLEENLYQSISQ